MPEWLTKFLESINIFPAIQKHFWSILFFMCVLGWSFFVLPINLFQILQIENLRSKYLEVTGLITYLSTVGLCLGLIYKGYKILSQWLTAKWDLSEQQKMLTKTTPVERTYLLKFVENHSQTATFSLYDGVVAGLIEKGILYKPNSQSNLSGEQDFNIYSWAYEYLQSHKDLLTQGDKNVQR